MPDLTPGSRRTADERQARNFARLSLRMRIFGFPWNGGVVSNVKNRQNGYIRFQQKGLQEKINVASMRLSFCHYES